jgi:hypothetical protein
MHENGLLLNKASWRTYHLSMCLLEMDDKQIFQKAVVVEIKRNLLSIKGLNKKKIDTIGLLLHKVHGKWLSERWC